MVMALRINAELEAMVMDWLWAHGQAAEPRDVLGALRQEGTITHATVTEALERLNKRGWLRRELVGPTHLYQPVASRESYVSRLMRDIHSSGRRPRAAAFVHLLSTLSPET